MTKKNEQTVLITGASSGIGEELAKLFARDGYQLVLVARRKEELARVQRELVDTYHATVVTIPTDLADPAAPARIVAQFKKSQITIDVLVNNAGFGLLGPFVKTDLERELAMIQVNVVALVQLTKLLVPGMVARGRGQILNVASTAAFQPGPLMAIYYATKAFVLSFSEALASELEGTGVTATALCPGPTATGFQEQARLGDIPLFRRTMTAADVARAGYQGLKAGRRVVVPGFWNQLGAVLVRLLPHRFVLRSVKRIHQ